MGLGTNSGGGKATYIHIIGGKFKESATEETPGAEKREWETKDGKSGTKWELTHDYVTGKITNLEYRDGEYGTDLMVTVQDPEAKIVIQISEKSRYYDDFAKKVKAIDFNEEVYLAPFDFDGENAKGKAKRFAGITIKQGDKKITSYYYDGKKPINKMPKVNEKEKEEMGDDYWTVYFTKLRVFLKKEIQGIKLPEYEAGLGGDIPMDEAPAPKGKDVTVDGDDDESSDLPF